MAHTDETSTLNADISFRLLNNVTDMMNNMSLQTRFLQIPKYDGKNMSLRDYLQDIQNGAAFIPPTSQSEYVKAAISNLQGEVRNVVYGEQINTVADYIKHLKTRLARGKTYNYYADAISRIRMKQGQTVGEFYDKIRILLSGGRAAYRAKHNTDPPAGERDPLQQLALASFIDGLPTNMSEAVEMREPATLEDAFKIAERLAIREDRRKRREISPSRVLYTNDSRPSYSERNSRPFYREWDTRPGYRDNVDYYRTRESRTRYREDRPRYSSYRDDGRRGSYRNEELSPYRYNESRSPSPAYQKPWQDRLPRDESLSPKFSRKPNSILKPSDEKGENTNVGCGNKYCRCRCCPSGASAVRSPLPNHREPLNYPEARRASPTTSRMTDSPTPNLGDEKKPSVKFL